MGTSRVSRVVNTVTVHEEEDPGEEGKVCSKCDRMLPEYEFSPQKARKKRRGNQTEIDTVVASCRSCAARRLRAWTYNISLAELEAVEAVTHCTVCSGELTQERGLSCRAIDHCHSSGRIRGVICNGCNAALGFARECPNRLRALADYIETHCGR